MSADADRERPAPPRPDVPDTHDGDAIITASWIGTGAFTVTAVAASVAPDALSVVSVPVAVVLSVVGVAAFAVAYLVAVDRSRTDLIGIGGLFFLVGCAPQRVARHLMASLAVEVLVSLATGMVGFATTGSTATNPLAFGILTWIYGLGLAGLWGARHGRFPPRPAGRD
jgi:hypothetical protein